MKNFSRSVFFLAAVLGTVSFAHSARADQVYLPERVFAPIGFDDNDNTQVVLYGHFPDTCYQAGPAVARIYGDEIHIENKALHWEAGSCIRAPVPWATTVNLGSLAAGTYSVYVENSRGGFIPFVDLVIKPSLTDERDDFHYAYIDGAIVSRTSVEPILTITGSYNLTCMEMDKVRVEEFDSVIVVLPIVRLRKGEPCGHPFAPIPFTYRVRLHPKSDRATLVHVRSVNGQALNQVIDR